MLDTTVILGVVMFTATVLLLVMVILFARSRLVSSGEVTWRTELDGRVKSAMAVADGGLLVVTEPKWVMYFKPAAPSVDSESGTEATE